MSVQTARCQPLFFKLRHNVIIRIVAQSQPINKSVKPYMRYYFYKLL